MKPDTSFHIKLTRSELSLLATTLGYIQIPLLGAGAENRIDVNPETGFEDAQISLQKQGLITYQQKDGWQIERLAFVLMEIIANPNMLYTLQWRNRKGIARRAFAYPMSGFPMFIQESDRLEFEFCPSADSLFAHIKEFFHLSTKSNCIGDLISIKKPESVIPKIWNNPEQELEEIAETGITIEDIELTFINQMENIGIFSQLQNKNGELCLVRSRCFLWNEKSIWGGSFTSDSTVEFLPLIRRDAYKLLEPDN